MNSKLPRLLLVAWALLSTGILWAEGLPVKSQLVRDACGACHRVDSQQRMSRISYARKTPEGWEETVKRMVRLHELQLSPSDARQVVQYLADNQGLTASELEKTSYAVEQRDEPEQAPNEAVKNACATCHSYGKLAVQRRSKEEWAKSKDLMMALTPTLVYQHRRIDWPAVADEAVAYLAQQFPLESPEWKKEKDQPAPGDSAWLVVGAQRGKGDYVGQVTLKTAADGSRQIQTSLEFADGAKQTVTGKGCWYGGYSWRGSGEWQDGRKVREVFHLSADGKTLKGRWFLFDHFEIGGDEVRYRLDGQPRVVAVFPKAVQRGTAHVELRIYGSNLPAAKADALNLGEGVTVEKVSETAADHMVVQVSVAGDAKVGRRDVKAGPAAGSGLLAVYDSVDYIRVLPEQAMARVGGERFRKKLTQFEARAFSKGADGVAGTADDLDLGSVKAAWRVNEAYSSAEDNDLKYVGRVDQNGLFTPAVEGPNPERPRSTNNAGDVWIEASFTPAAGNAKLLTARAYLLVTVPLYNRNLIP